MSAPQPLRGWWEGRSGLLFPIVLAAFATYLLIGQVIMPVPDGSDVPGPRFFPALIIAAMYVLALILAVSLIRTPQSPVAEVEIDPEGKVRPSIDDTPTWFSDWPRLAWAIGGFAVFIVLLPLAGWVLTAALLFWCLARSLGSAHPLRDVGVALVFSSLLYLTFAGLLSVNLPAGALFGGRI